MRKRKVSGGVTLNAVAGTHVVTLGLDLSEARRAGCLGFAIRREDHTEGERVWLRGLKTFKETDPGAGPGQSVSTRFHPIQAFQWADYGVKPGYDYTYTAFPLTGSPRDLVLGAGVSVRVQTERELGATHSVFFNRGAIASQEYASRFMNLAPDQLTDPRERAAAYKWLSRGLLEALLAFIARATGPEFALRGAIYEFRRAEVLQALKAAAARGVDTQIVYDGIDDAQLPNEQAIAANGIGDLCTPRTRGSIMHNKFFVLLQAGEPVAVWTGSTNLSENGLFGQLNAGHQVEDTTVARAFRDYWDQLRANPAPKDLKLWVGANSPPAPVPAPAGTTTVMSPRAGLAVLDDYARVAGSAGRALFMTFAFGMNKRFREVYQRVDDVLRVALMEQEGTGSGLAEGRIFIDKLRRQRNVLVAVGKNKNATALDNWKRERTDGIGTHVDWVHTKFMLVDPLSADPTVVTGSANFSEASTDTNDENMLVIRGDTRVADIYLGEFMRCFSHHAFREALTFGNPPLNHLHIKPAAWQMDHFDPAEDAFLRRRYFSKP